MCVYPMPLVGEVTFASVCVRVCPCCGAPDGAVVLGFEDLCEDGSRFGCEECLCHEADLIMDYADLVLATRRGYASYRLRSMLQPL